MRVGSERPRHVVLVGAGRVGMAVAARLPPGWSLVVVDRDVEALAAVVAVRPDVVTVEGDASSRLTLARCGLDARSVLIAAASSDEVNVEAARLARDHFGVEERVVVATDPGPAEGAGLAAAELVRAADAVAGQVVNRVSIEASRAVDIGLGVGEILQVTVLEGSPAVGRPLNEFGARHWLVAAVYRGGGLIVPHGDTRVDAGDRVLLVGEPGDLLDVAPYFRGGAPVFPSQYGAHVAWRGGPAAGELATWFAGVVGADPPVEVPAALADVATVSGVEWRRWLDGGSIGCVVLAGTGLPWWVRLGLVRSRLHALLVDSRRPCVVARGERREVRRLLVAVRDVRDQREVLLAGIDLARLTGATIETLTVGPVGQEAANGGAAAAVDRLARLYALDIPHRSVQGNPVARIRAAAADYDLLVLGIRREHNTPLSPDVSTFLLHEVSIPTVFVPWSPAD